MYGQMTAGSWIYIGTQGILQGTYETFAAVARQAFGGTLAGTLTLTGGCGGMGGAQPLAVTLNGGVCLSSTSTARARRRVEHRYLDVSATTSTTPSPRSAREGAGGRCRSGWSATAPTSARAAAPRRVRSTSSPTRPAPTTRWPTCRRRRRRRLADYAAQKPRSSPTGPASRWPARRGDGRLPWTPAPRSSTTATRSATRPAGRLRRAFAFPGFVPAYIRPLFCEGKGPFRWAALSGDPADIAATDRAVLDLFPTTTTCTGGSRGAGARRLPGPAGADLLAGYGERGRRGCGSQRARSPARRGQRRSIVIVPRHHLATLPRLRSPLRSLPPQTEAMADKVPITRRTMRCTPPLRYYGSRMQ
jgi:urocanate hydratase